MDNYADNILAFLRGLHLETALPRGVEVMNPYRQEAIFAHVKEFYKKYYADNSQRILIAGINPGRFGGGMTGIPFTDPLKLERECGISNSMPKKAELSADFIYRVIAAFGGNRKFYQRFYISSVCPLGFTKGGKNLNYYDVKELQEAVYPFILQTMRAQLQWGLNREVAYCLGEGKNYQFFTWMNGQEHFFDRIIALPHPRFIMQYRRREITEYIACYLRQLGP